MTILMATHEMGFARRGQYQDLLLDQGSILEEGPPSNSLGPPANHEHSSSFSASPRPAGCKFGQRGSPRRLQSDPGRRDFSWPGSTSSTPAGNARRISSSEGSYVCRASGGSSATIACMIRSVSASSESYFDSTGFPTRIVTTGDLPSGLRLGKLRRSGPHVLCPPDPNGNHWGPRSLAGPRCAPSTLQLGIKEGTSTWNSALGHQRHHLTCCQRLFSFLEHGASLPYLVRHESHPLHERSLRQSVHRRLPSFQGTSPGDRVCQASRRWPVGRSSCDGYQQRSPLQIPESVPLRRFGTGHLGRTQVERT